MTAGTTVRAETSTENRGWVELAVAGSAEERVAIQRSLSELLSRLGLQLFEQGKAPADEQRAALASARVELDEVECRITLTTGPDARVLMFRRVARKGSALVMAETVSLIIHGAVEELLQVPRHPMVSSAPPELKAETPAPASKEWSEYALDVSAFAGSRSFGGGAPLVAAAGISLSAGKRIGGLLPELWLSGAYNTPFDATGSLVELRAQVLSLRGGLSLRLFEHEDWYLQAGLGAGADVFFTDAHAAPPNRFGHESASASPIATALLSAHYTLGSHFDLFVAFNLDVDLQPRRFLADLPTGPERLYEAARVHPALVFGFDFAAIGAKETER